jgi:hypothetical protein
MSKTTTIATHRPVAETLRKMRVGTVETFPISQYNSVRSSKHTTLLMDHLNGADWTIKPNIQDMTVEVTRLS